jgi:preprotein translocase subunit SecB
VADLSEELARLVDAAQLQAVEYLHLSAERNEDVDLARLHNGEISVEPSYRLGTWQDETRFGIRLKIEITTEIGVIAAEAISSYATPGDHEQDITEDLLLEFANQAGLMMLFPYLRQGVADLSQRVFGLPLLMPILMRRDLQFSEHEASDQP